MVVLKKYQWIAHEKNLKTWHEVIKPYYQYQSAHLQICIMAQVDEGIWKKHHIRIQDLASWHMKCLAASWDDRRLGKQTWDKSLCSPHNGNQRFTSCLGHGVVTGKLSCQQLSTQPRAKGHELVSNSSSKLVSFNQIRIPYDIIWPHPILLYPLNALWHYGSLAHPGSHIRNQDDPTIQPHSSTRDQGGDI